MTSLRSDERVGHHDTLATILFYFLLIAIYAIIFIYLLFWDKIQGYKYVYQRELTDEEKTKLTIDEKTEAPAYLMERGNGKKIRTEWLPIGTRSVSSLLRYVGIIVWYVLIFWWIYFEINNPVLLVIVSGLSLIPLGFLVVFSFFTTRKKPWPLTKGD